MGRRSGPRFARKARAPQTPVDVDLWRYILKRVQAEHPEGTPQAVVIGKAVKRYQGQGGQWRAR